MVNIKNSNKVKFPQHAILLPVKTKSNRKLDEVVNNKDVHVTQSMQSFVAKKLASLIDDQVQFVDVPDQVIEPDDDDCDNGIRLFSSSTAPVKALSPDSVPIQPPKRAKKRKSRKEDASPDESTKLAESVVDPSYILDQVELKSWHKRDDKRLAKKVDSYNLRKGQLYTVEPSNEFTGMKKKNNWEYSKIRQPIKRKLE